MFKAIRTATVLTMCIALIGYAEDPCSPPADPEIHGIAAASMGEEFTVLIHNEHVGFDIPGLFIFELEDPARKGGRWYFQLDDQLSIEFISGRSGNIAALRFYEPGYTHRMTRTSN